MRSSAIIMISTLSYTAAESPAQGPASCFFIRIEGKGGGLRAFWKEGPEGTVNLLRVAAAGLDGDAKRAISEQARRLFRYINDKLVLAERPLRKPIRLEVGALETRMAQQQTLLEVLLKKLPQALETALGEGVGEECRRLLVEYQRDRAPHGKVSLGACSPSFRRMTHLLIRAGRTHTERRGHEVAGRACTLERFKGRGAGECVGGCEVSGLTPPQHSDGSSSPSPVALLSARSSMLTTLSCLTSRKLRASRRESGSRSGGATGQRQQVGVFTMLGQSAHASFEARRT
jgi:hypothetical protein